MFFGHFLESEIISVKILKNSKDVCRNIMMEKY